MAGESLSNTGVGPDSLGRKVMDLMRSGRLKARAGTTGIIPGRVFKIGDITLKSPQHFTLKETGLSGFIGRKSSADNVRDIIEQLKNFLLNSGYPFAEIRMDQQELPPGRVRLLLDVASGSGYKLGRVLYTGTRTKSDILDRLSLLRRGEPFSLRHLTLARRKLARTGYFSNLWEGQLRRDGGKNVLYPALHLTDIQGSSISGLFGYASSQENKSEITGFMDVTLRNLLGTARDFDFHFMAAEREKQVKLAYVEPWFGPLPLGGGFRFFLDLEDSVYNEIAWGVSLFQDMTFQSKYIITFDFQKNEMLDLSQKGDILSTKSSAAITGIETILDWRNRAPLTTSGGRLGLRLGGIRRDASDSLAYLFQNRTNISFFLPIVNRLFFHLAGRTESTWPLKKSLTNRGNLFETGGAGTLRGFRENAFITNFYAYGNLELQYLLSRESRVFLFADPGLINRDKGDIYWRRILGYGLWADLGGKNWVFGLGYALSNQRGIGDGLVHARVVNRF
jgi:outer membrane protein assembly factor BamA